MRKCECVIDRFTKYIRCVDGNLVEGLVSEGKTYKGYFHRWFEKDRHIYAIVETLDGSIIMPDACDLRFTDRPDHETKPVYDTITDIVNQLESCGYTCEGGPLEMNMAFIALKKMAKREHTDVKIDADSIARELARG